MAETRIPAASKCETHQTFYVISHGWHTGIAIDSKDLINRAPSLKDEFGNGDYLEIGWGDEQFYQASEITTGLALRAILLPTTTVLHIVEIPGEPQHYFPSSEIIRLSVPESGYEKMLEYILKSFMRDGGDKIKKLGRGLYGNSRFYRANGNFHAFNTCNTWVSKAVASTGFPMKSNIITADEVMLQLKESTLGDCFSVHLY